MRSYHKGSAHVVIIIILVVALLGTLGFVFYQNFIEKKPVEQPKPADTANDTPTKPDTTPKADETKYLVIKEWGVKLPVEGVLSDARYYMRTITNEGDAQEQVAYLTTEKIDTSCSGSDCSVAALGRGKAEDNYYGPAGQLVGKYKDHGTQVGGYYYVITLGNGPQTDDQAYESKLRAAFPEAFNKLVVE